MKTSALIARIIDQCPGFVTVDHALTSAAEMPFPAAMVTPSKVDTMPDNLVGSVAHSQLVTQTFTIFFLLRRSQDGTFTSIADDLDALSDQLRAALAGWSPDADHTPMSFVGAQLDKYHTGQICWREDFSVETELRVMR